MQTSPAALRRRALASSQPSSSTSSRSRRCGARRSIASGTRPTRVCTPRDRTICRRTRPTSTWCTASSRPARTQEAFPTDTYYFTIAELHAASLAKDCIISKIQEFEGQLKVQFDKELAEMQQPVAEAEVG